MKLVIAAALAALTPFAASAQTAPAQPVAQAVPAAKFSVDATPIMDLVADTSAKAVLVKHGLDLEAHPQYEMGKHMTLRAVAPYSEGMITDAMLTEIDLELAAIK